MDILDKKQFSYNFIRVGEEFMNLGEDDDIEKKICIIAKKDRNIFYGLHTIVTIKEDSEVLYLKRMKRMLENCRPYCIRFSAADKADDTKIYFQGMKDDSLKEVIEYKFRQMLDYREIYLHKRDYDFIKEKIEIYN